MFKKSPLKATRLHRHKRRVRIVKSVFFFAAIAFVVIGLAWLSHLQALALLRVEVTGNAGIDSAEIQKIAEKHLAGAYAGLFQKSNKLIYPKKAIQEEIKAAFPSIQTLAIHTENKALRVELTERKPAFVWCKGTPADAEREKCYFMDSVGYLFSDAPSFSGNAYFVFYGIIDAENPIGQIYLSQAELENLEKFTAKLKASEIIITSLFAKDVDVREVYLDEGGKILFKASQDVEDIATSIDLLKKNTKLFTQEEQEKLDYIDMRFGNKVYYKFIGDNTVETSEKDGIMIP